MAPGSNLLAQAAMNQQHYLRVGLRGGLQGGLRGLGGFTTVTDNTNAAPWASFMLDPSPPPSPVTPQPEDEIAWLRRRVREVLWQP